LATMAEMVCASSGVRRPAAALKVTKDRAAKIVGEDEVRRQWRSAPADGNFTEWCREIGVQYPTPADELRTAGLIRWELARSR
jgi:hypothetical protein